jgi:hypothetical protein
MTLSSLLFPGRSLEAGDRRERPGLKNLTHENVKTLSLNLSLDTERELERPSSEARREGW